MPLGQDELSLVFQYKISRRIWVILLVVQPFFSSAFAQSYFQQEVNYRIQVRLDDVHHELSGYETIQYVNNSQDTLKALYFHLWPNGYLNNQTELASQLTNLGGKQRLFEDPELQGYIDSLDFKINGLRARWHLLPGQPDICKVYLGKAATNGDTLTITTPFHVKIPKGVSSRMGHIGESYQISQWYPKPAVYDNSGWHQISNLDQGEFYAEYGDFDVAITLPSNYVVGATGNLQNEQELAWLNKVASDTTNIVATGPLMDDFPPSSEVSKTLHYTESNIHDFAWFADKRFHVVKGTLALPHSGRKVTTWVMFTNHQALLWKEAILYVNRSLEKFSKWNGDYPYNSFTAVQSALSAGSGMEYPGLTVIGNSKDAYSLDEVIAHEVAHSWYYGALGSDERRYPFMDEGITSANEVRYMNECYPQKKLWEVYTNNYKLAKFLHMDKMPVRVIPEIGWLSQARDNLEQPLDLHASDYTTLNYSLMIYNKAGFVFNYLRAYLGDSLYDSTMQAYLEQWKFKHPQPSDLKMLFESNTGKELGWFFGDFISTTKRLDYRIVRLEGQKILIENRGELASPQVISGMKGDSICFEKWFDGFSGQKWLVLPAGDCSEFKIDPNHVTPELYRLNNNIRNRGFFPKADPLQTQLYLSLEDPEKRYLMYLPAINWTRENGFMVGLALHNGILTPKPFEYFVMPFISFNEPGLAGYGKLSFNFTPFEKLIRLVKVNLEGTQFGAPGHQHYQLVKAGTELYFRSGRMANLRTQKLFGNFIVASDLSQIVLQEKASVNYYQQFGYQMEKGGFVNPFKILATVESNHNFIKTSVLLNYKISYQGKKNGLEIRLFAGAMLKNNSADPIYSLAPGGRSGSELYLFQGTFPDRFAGIPSSFWSRQMSVTEGGLVSPVNGSLGYSRRMISMSFTSSLPGKSSRLPVKPFVNLLLNDHGGGVGNGSPFFYEAGLKAGLWNFFEIYFPILVSENIKSTNSTFNSSIRLVFNLDAFGQSKLNSGSGIQIR